MKPSDFSWNPRISWNPGWEILVYIVLWIPIYSLLNLFRFFLILANFIPFLIGWWILFWSLDSTFWRKRCTKVMLHHHATDSVRFVNVMSWLWTKGMELVCCTPPKYFCLISALVPLPFLPVNSSRITSIISWN